MQFELTDDEIKNLMQFRAKQDQERLDDLFRLTLQIVASKWFDHSSGYLVRQGYSEFINSFNASQYIPEELTGRTREIYDRLKACETSLLDN